MFLRPKRSSEISIKEGQMPDKRNPTTSSSSLFASPRLFVGFSPTPKGLSDSETATMSPTSILETKPFSPSANPFFTERNSRKHHPVGLGLGLVDALNDNTKVERNSFKPESRMVLFGSQLKIQIPTIRSNSISPTGSVESPQSPIEFGVKTRNTQLFLHSPLGFDPLPPSSSPRIMTGCLSSKEMELSEDYTCVISHGPNPRTTHIFDNCIVESCGDGYIASRKDDFLSFCHACKKNLSPGKDIFMYRGEKAFCSQECRQREMLFDEGMEKFSPDLSDLL